MNFFHVVFTIIGVIGTVILIAHLWYQKRLKPIRLVFEKLTVEEKQKVLDLISSYTQIPQEAAVLAEFSNTKEKDYIISIPKSINSLWKGRSYRIVFNQHPRTLDIEIEEVDYIGDHSRLNGKIFHPYLVPLTLTKTGKKRNMWSMKMMLSRNKALKKFLESLIDEKQDSLLASVLLNRPVIQASAEPAFQLRIGAGLNWIQGHEVIKCDKCKKSMKFLFNLPGFNTGRDGIGDFVYYVFSCKNHPNEIKYTLQAF